MATASRGTRPGAWHCARRRAGSTSPSRATTWASRTPRARKARRRSTHARARTYYEKPCKLDDGVGCFNLGNVFRLGEGTPIDLQRALGEFQRGCDLEAAIACTEAGIIYWEGQVVPPDLDRAAALFDTGCRLGSQVACKNGDALRDARKP